MGKGRIAMDYIFRKVNKNDGRQVIDVLNYYIENSFAAFLDNKLSYDQFKLLMDMYKGYPFYVIENKLNDVIGFGALGRYHPAQVFNRVAKLTYFILPAHTQKGLGTQLLNILSTEAKEMGIDSLLADISSLNQASLNFHIAQGFTECGKFTRIGEKQNTNFDVIWMQKYI